MRAIEPDGQIKMAASKWPPFSGLFQFDTIA